MNISEQLATALTTLVLASDAVATAPSDRQAVRRAIEAATVVAQLARREGFGDRPDPSIAPTIK